MTNLTKTQSHTYGLPTEGGRTKNNRFRICSLNNINRFFASPATDYFTINNLLFKLSGLIVFFSIIAIVKELLAVLITQNWFLNIIISAFTTAILGTLMLPIIKKVRLKKDVYIVWDSVFYKKVKRLVAAVVLIVISNNAINAQGSDSTAANSLSLRPLSELIELAIQNAPELKNNQVDYARQQLALKLQKRSWADNISVNGTSLYGNGSVVDANNTGSSTTYVLSGRKSLNFNIGLGIRITGGDLVNRGTKAEFQRLQLDRIQNERQILESKIREVVINLYSELELALKVVKLKGEMVENQRMVFGIAEKYFKEGNYKPADYSAMLDKITAAQEQYEQSKAEAKKLALLLKNIVNVSIWE